MFRCLTLSAIFCFFLFLTLLLSILPSTNQNVTNVADGHLETMTEDDTTPVEAAAATAANESETEGNVNQMETNQQDLIAVEMSKDLFQDLLRDPTKFSLNSNNNNGALTKPLNIHGNDAKESWKQFQNSIVSSFSLNLTIFGVDG